MLYKTKILTSIVIVASIFNISYADNKSDLLSKITTLETNLTTLNSTLTTSAQNKVYTLSSSYDTTYKNLGYSAASVDYLVRLWKISSNFKKDIATDLNSLTSEITNKISSELTTLSTIKNNINLNYSTVSDSQKTTLETQIAAVTKDYTDINSTYTDKITALNTKYTSSLSSYQTTLASVLSANSATLKTLETFASNYDSLYTLKTTFDSNYSTFKSYYLSYSTEITAYVAEKQTYYVDYLWKDLQNLIDQNVALNSSLKDYLDDIWRYKQVLLENFWASLKENITSNYASTYSDSDITSLNTRYSTLKNRYYDSDGNLLPTAVLNNASWALSEISDLKTNYTTVNANIIDLNGTWTTYSSLDNVKIRINNAYATFYNANYTQYRDDIYVKLKEKLSLSLLETKNVLVAADSIDLRYQILSDKIEKSTDLTYINTQINTFRSDMKKYDYLNSSVLDSKINKLNYNLVKFIVEKELALFKYVKLTPKTDSYNEQLTTILSTMKSNYTDSKEYVTYLKSVLSKVDTALDNSKLSTKNRFVLLLIKLKLVQEINNQ